MERDAFLAAARHAAAAAQLTDPGRGPYPMPERSAEGLTEIFRAGLESLDGVVYEAGDGREAAAIVAGILGVAPGSGFLAWDQSQLPVDGLLDALAALGYTPRPDSLPEDDAGRRAHQLGYYDCAVGLTGAEAGLADSGSIVVSSGPGKPRMASLIPDVHVALLPRRSIYPSLSHWIAEHPDGPGLVSNWTVISGPSRTADIEQVLTLGVHGPRAVHVVLV